MAVLASRKDASGFEVVAGDINTRAIVGGKEIDKDSFVAALNASYHGNEYFVDFNHEDSAMGLKPALIDGKVGFTSGEFEHSFSMLNGQLKWVIRFVARPASNIVVFRLTHSPSIWFSKAIPVSQEMINQGAVPNPRPDVVGGYAIRINKRDGKYKIGMVDFLSLPSLTDRDSDVVYCEMDITPVSEGVSRMTITMPALWLDDPERVYPVVLS